MRITILLPFPVTKPVGGARIMYEYANRFVALGHQVTVLHTLRRPFKKMRSPLWWKRLMFTIRGAKRPAWFPLDKRVKSLIVDEITDSFVPDGDVLFSTWWQMAFALATLSPQKGVPVNLVQDYENWTGQADLVNDSYRLPLRHAAISNWLRLLVEKESGRTVQLLPNAIDTTQFLQDVAPQSRDPLSVLALYSEEKRKGTSYILDALQPLRNKFPLLRFSFFGVYPRPESLPAWVNYYQKPKDLKTLYNQHAIFLSASLGEGWALPPAEAMACGCAVVCTNIGGHADYAKENQTAVLIPTENTTAMITALTLLFENTALRIQLAENSRKQLLEKFSWEQSLTTALTWFDSLQKE
ncbi:MAG: glycosyltransferase family 4 protein [Bacteroidetes bacterium]|nr:glycosyltransferase family 4 protein [Bacteroidota bacterium]